MWGHSREAAGGSLSQVQIKSAASRTAKGKSRLFPRGLATRVGRQKQKVGRGKQAPSLIDGLDDTAWGRASVHATASCGANVEHKIKAFLAGGILALGLFGVAMAGQLEDGHKSPIEPTSVGKGETAVPMVTHGGTFNVPATINGQLTLKFVVDSGAADVSIPVDVVMAPYEPEQSPPAIFSTSKHINWRMVLLSLRSGLSSAPSRSATRLWRT